MNRLEKMNIAELYEELEYHMQILETATDNLKMCQTYSKQDSIYHKVALRHERIANKCISQIKDELMFA